MITREGQWTLEQFWGRQQERDQMIKQIRWAFLGLLHILERAWTTEWDPGGPLAHVARVVGEHGNLCTVAFAGKVGDHSIGKLAGHVKVSLEEEDVTHELQIEAKQDNLHTLSFVQLQELSLLFGGLSTVLEVEFGETFVRAIENRLGPRPEEASA